MPPRPSLLRDRRRDCQALAGIVAVLALAAILAGCGAYTKSNFVARADAICASTVRQTRSIAPPSFSSSAGKRMSALANYLGAALPIEQSEATQIRALPRPAGNARARGVLARYLAALAQAVGEYRELEAAAKRENAQGVARAEAALATNPVTSLATSYGLRSCGTPGATVS